jgi:hypothetical protein
MTEVELDTLLEAITGADHESIDATEDRYLGEPGEQWLMELRRSDIGDVCPLIALVR